MTISIFKMQRVGGKSDHDHLQVATSKTGLIYCLITRLQEDYGEEYRITNRNLPRRGIRQFTYPPHKQATSNRPSRDPSGMRTQQLLVAPPRPLPLESRDLEV